MNIYMMHASHTKFGHTHNFVQLFSTIENLNEYLTNHPYVELGEVTIHTLDEK